MENTEILVNNEAIEVAEEIVTKTNSKNGIVIAVIAGVVALGGAAAYIISKRKAKKDELVLIDEAEPAIVEDGEEEVIEDEAE